MSVCEQCYRQISDNILFVPQPISEEEVQISKAVFSTKQNKTVLLCLLWRLF